ncbi:MAG: hypothetical protein ABIS50_22155 [Luteolibacter sp.]|uniref:hypothetical protein n=1 Tax=Luteolibacter sp. TaxID=1962973 RepID=UPI0032658594
MRNKRICFFSLDRDDLESFSHEWFSPDFLPFRRFFSFRGSLSVVAGSSGEVRRKGASKGGVTSNAVGIFNIRRQLGQTIPLPS